MATKNVVELAKDSLVSKALNLDDISATTKDGYEISTSVNFSVKADLEKFASGLGLDDLKNAITACVIIRFLQLKIMKSCLRNQMRVCLRM